MERPCRVALLRAPNSVSFELKRLGCHGWFYVDQIGDVSEVDQRHFALLQYRANGDQGIGHLSTCRHTASPSIRPIDITIGTVGQASLNWSSNFDCYPLASSRARLALLAAKLQVSSSTIRRWFAKTGSLRPKRLMQWVQACEVWDEMVVSGCTLEAVSFRLGFDHPDAVRRMMRRLCGTSSVQLGIHRTHSVLLALMRSELNG